jgi:aerobic carbon-monoxide dehydrogenase small subunit
MIDCAIEFPTGAIIWRDVVNQIVNFTLNGRPTRLDLDGERTLLWVLRIELGLTGTKFGCGGGFCGACTVIVDKDAVRSCLVSVKEIAGKDVLTIEGLAKSETVHPLQDAFVRHDALQCGFCTPGMILTAYALLLSNPKASRDEIIRGMDDNLCRCGAHKRILEAVESAAGRM